MKVYVIEHIIGAIAVNEKGEPVAYKPAPKNLDDAVEEVLKFERGEMPYIIKQLAEELKNKEGIEKVIVEDENTAKFFNSEGFDVELAPGNPIAVSVRSNVGELAVKLGFASSTEEYEKFMREAGIELTRRKLRRAAEKRDQLAIQAIRAVDDIDKTVNLFAARLREWYSLHFPELDELVREHEDYIRIVAELGHRENVTKENLVKLGFSEGKAEKIAEAARKSIGADLSDFDIKPIQTLASIALELYKLRGELTEYIAAVMKEVAPNITALVGPLL
ncbi:MAG TPA: C/D box methylation guide ribonucleoprotein complex aNOP56 subunit, partial [Desulfurococcaceae archaeon]|nr:C/D box methylation guide ribonucleoprotein complex aNOP56 subunit [Desulfurococcaceae archaeon]